MGYRPFAYEIAELRGDLSEAIAAMRRAVSLDESHKTELSRISAEASATSPRWE